MTARNGKLGTKAQAAILALMTEPSIRRAAASVGLAEKTLRRWLAARPEFAEAYRHAREEAFAQSVAMLAQRASEAVLTLYDLMTDRECPPATRAHAAGKILELGMRARELGDLAERITELETFVTSMTETRGYVDTRSNWPAEAAPGNQPGAE